MNRRMMNGRGARRTVLSSSLKEKKERSVYIIREAYELHRKAGVLWSMGKDSAVLLWLCRRAFLGTVPFPVINIDTGFEFTQLTAWRDEMAKKLSLDLRIARPSSRKLDLLNKPIDFFHHHKTIPFLHIIQKLKLKIVYVGIRGDEHGIRAKERYFSLRNRAGEYDLDNQPFTAWDYYPGRLPRGMHYRIHPLLHWSETDIWEYIRQENIPIPDLYFSKNGLRYRSLDCEPCCEPIRSEAKTIDDIISEIRETDSFERQGRAQDKEDPYTMERLRALGYM